MALVFTALAAYTCKFVKVLQTDYAPIFFGIWKVEGAIGDGKGYLDNTNECIAWTDTDMFEDGSVRAAKTFTVWATILGCLLLAASLLQLVGHLFQFNWQWSGSATTTTTTTPRQGGTFLVCLASGATVCAALCALFFNVLGSDLCSRDTLKCQWGSGAYMSIASITFWMAAAIFLIVCLFYDVNDCNSSNNNGGYTNRAVVFSQQQEQSRNASRRTQSAASSPRPRTSQSTSSPRHSRQSSAERLSSTDRLERVQNTMSKYRRGQSAVDRQGDRKREQDKNNTNSHLEEEEEEEEEKTPDDADIDPKVPMGTPLVSISEDDDGNRIKTTIFRYMDEKGEPVLEKTIEVLPDEKEEI